MAKLLIFTTNYLNSLERTPIISLAAFLLLFLNACTKCFDCYLVRTPTDGSPATEAFAANKCGKEVKQLEEDQLICVNAECHYECR